MNPGATMRPVASSTRAALLPGRRPILAILPFLSPTSARYRGTRVPSTIVPPLISVSNSAIQPSLFLFLCFISASSSRRKKRLCTLVLSVLWDVNPSSSFPLLFVRENGFKVLFTPQHTDDLNPVGDGPVKNQILVKNLSPATCAGP